MFKAASLEPDAINNIASLPFINNVILRRSSVAATEHEQTRSTGTTDVVTANCDDDRDVDSRRSTAADHGSSAFKHPTSVMPRELGNEPICSEIDRVLSAKASRLCQMHPFGRSDLDDLHQVLRAAWLANRHSYDPCQGNGWSLLKTVVERTAVKLREKARAAKRCCPSNISLGQQELRTSSHSSLDRNHDCRRSSSGPSLLTQEQTDLQLDLPKLINRLPTPLADLCEKLMYDSPAEIARATGTPPSTLASRVAAIRRRFENENLSKYL